MKLVCTLFVPVIQQHSFLFGLTWFTVFNFALGRHVFSLSARAQDTLVLFFSSFPLLLCHKATPCVACAHAECVPGCVQVRHRR